MKRESSKLAARIDAALLSLLAVAPALPYGAWLVRHPIPRFSMFGDYAILEIVTRLVWSGRTLLGPYSRFGFSHPGPLYFYLLAPIYSLFRGQSTGLFVGAFLINACALIAVVAALRLLASRAHAIAGVLTMFCWLAAFGNVFINPWGPLVIALPLTAFLVLASLFARGGSAAACPAAAFGALVAQTHVATVVTVVFVGALATVAFAVTVRRRGGISKRQRRHAAAAGAIVVLACVPPLIEQCISPEGNLTKLARFFADQHGELMPTASAMRNWATAASWLPVRLVHATLREEGWVPLPMRWDAAPDTTSRTAVVVMILHAAAVSIAGVVAWKRRDTASLALMVVGVGAQLLAVLALRALVGPCLYYLLFWVAAGNAVAWLGAVATATDAIATRLRRQNPVALRRTLIAICGIVGMAGAEATTRLQYAWIVHNNAGTPFIRYDIEAAYAVLVDRLRRDHASPVVHFEGAWTSATIVALELFRDGIPTYFLDRDRWVYGRPLSATEAKRPLHIYVRDPFWDLPFAACLESLAATGFVEILVAPASVDGCP